jgi:hypothetical protein
MGADEDGMTGLAPAEGDGDLAEAIDGRLEARLLQVLDHGRGQPVLVARRRGDA